MRTSLVVVLGMTFATGCSSVDKPGVAKSALTRPGYVGCFVDDGDSRALPTHIGDGYTIEGCQAAAAARGLPLAGLQYYGQCWAGTQFNYAKVSDSECDTPCTASSSETCGGAWRNSVYHSQLPSGYQGCYTDSDVRALPVYFGDGYTIESCQAVGAANGYAYVGLQWYGQCFGGNSLGYSLDDETQCNTPCANRPAEMCGGAWHNSVYSTNGYGSGS